MRRAVDVNFLFGVDVKKASSPPLFSTVLMPEAETRKRTGLPKESLKKDASWRFTANVRLDLLFA